MKEIHLGDKVRIAYPQTDTEHVLYLRDPNRLYKVLEIYVQGRKRTEYVRCEDIREDGSSCGVWHFHSEALVPHDREISTGGEHDSLQKP